MREWLGKLLSPANQGVGPGENQDLYTLHRYLDDQGNFSYEKYAEVQIEANKLKLDMVWAQEENLAFIAKYIQDQIPNPSFGLCHGTRRGLEQKWLRERLGCEVLGTELSDTATQFEHTIEWDFHDVKPEWVKAVDFIYTNSFDHSYDPKKCLDAWVSCLKDTGILIIEHSADHVSSRESDPFGAQLYVMPYLILLWGEGAYSVREILDAPVPAKFLDNAYEAKFLIVRPNR